MYKCWDYFKALGIHETASCLRHETALSYIFTYLRDYQ